MEQKHGHLLGLSQPAKTPPVDSSSYVVSLLYSPNTPNYVVIVMKTFLKIWY